MYDVTKVIAICDKCLVVYEVDPEILNLELAAVSGPFSKCFVCRLGSK